MTETRDLDPRAGAQTWLASQELSLADDVLWPNPLVSLALRHVGVTFPTDSPTRLKALDEFNFVRYAVCGS